jgi:hypothetical protein
MTLIRSRWRAKRRAGGLSEVAAGSDHAIPEIVIYRYAMKPYRSLGFESHRLPRELEAALREFGKWSDAQLLSEQTATTPISPLYHYTGEGALRGILELEQLWCFAHSDQRDTEEFSYSLGLACNEFERLARLGDGLTRQFGTCTRNMIAENDLTKVFDYYLFSLTDSRDLESQWDEYGGHGTGFQIGFAPALFKPDQPLSPEADHNAYVGKVIYGDSESTAAHRAVIDKAAELVSRVGKAHGIKSGRIHRRYINGMAKELIARQLIWRSLVSKREIFRPESEMRYVTLNQHKHFDGKTFTVKGADGRDRRHIKYPIPLKAPGHITEIIVGPNAPPDAEDMVRDLLNRFGYPAVTVDRSLKKV